MKRKVCVVTGTRAEYGILKPVLRAIKNSKDLDLFLLVSGMHLSSEFGKTINLIKIDGFKIHAMVPMNPRMDDAKSMAVSVGKGIIGMSESFSKINPDITVVLGDRIEALSATIASAYLNIPIAHIHGGDASKAGLDESARHAITKMSHIHFVATKKSMNRVIKMGENSKNVYLVGAPGLDGILSEPLLSKEELSQKHGFNKNELFMVLLQHPVTTQISEAKFQMKETLEAIKKLGILTFIIYPNSDAGGRSMIAEIEKYKHLTFVKIFKNLPHNEYLSFLKYASVLVGNSSSGIIEAPSFKLPVVNIGIRQEGRERSTNVIDVPHDKNAIVKAIKKALYDKKFREKVKRCKNPYGDGHAAERIVKVLSTIKLDKNLLQKQITY